MRRKTATSCLTPAAQADIKIAIRAVVQLEAPAVFNGITEALYKPLKEAYKRLNRVDATVQILDTHARDHAFKCWS
ncbi:hypothetical protein BGX38DRAFT_1273095 [Terfezia claveryi]|nr:hypothetical protein BGX38DRAFT_1273095 [Terfezia claveryi]